MTALYETRLGSTPLSSRLRRSSNARFHCPAVAHAEIAALNAITPSSTLRRLASKKISRAYEPTRPYELITIVTSLEV